MRAIVLCATIVSAALCAVTDAFSQSAAAAVGAKQVGTLRTAVNSAVLNLRNEFEVLHTELAAFKKCAEGGEVYAPGNEKADVSGCLSVGGISWNQKVPDGGTCRYGNREFEMGDGQISINDGRVKVLYNIMKRYGNGYCDTLDTFTCSRTYDGKSLSECHCSYETLHLGGCK